MLIAACPSVSGGCHCRGAFAATAAFAAAAATATAAAAAVAFAVATVDHVVGPAN